MITTRQALPAAGWPETQSPHTGLLAWGTARRSASLALTALGAVIISGTWLAWKHVGSPAELSTTMYWRFPLVKLLLLLAVLSASGYNQFVLNPADCASTCHR